MRLSIAGIYKPWHNFVQIPRIEVSIEDEEEDVVGGEVEDELHGEEEEGVAEEGLRKGLALPDNLLEDYYALETEVSTDLTVSTEVDFLTELDRHYESSTEEEDEKV